MAPAVAFAPVARPRLAAATFFAAGANRRTVLAEAVGVAFAIRTDAAAPRVHDVHPAAWRLAR